MTNLGIENKTFMFTGRIRITRHEAQDLVESLGGIAGSSVSGNTDYLVVGEDPGSKLDRARVLGVTILTEQEFFTLVEAERKDSVHLTPTQQDGTEDLTDEQWEGIAKLGIPVMTGEQLERLLKYHSPSYENPKRLEGIEKEITLLPPSICKFCGATIPYSVYTEDTYTTPEGTYYCFNCRQYSDQDHHNCWYEPLDLGAAIVHVCFLCDNFREMTDIEQREHQDHKAAEDWYNSAERVLSEHRKEEEDKAFLEKYAPILKKYQRHICSSWERVDTQSDSGFYKICKDCGKIMVVKTIKVAENTNQEFEDTDNPAVGDAGKGVGPDEGVGNANKPGVLYIDARKERRYQQWVRRHTESP